MMKPKPMGEAIVDGLNRGLKPGPITPWGVNEESAHNPYIDTAAEKAPEERRQKTLPKTHRVICHPRNTVRRLVIDIYLKLHLNQRPVSCRFPLPMFPQDQGERSRLSSNGRIEEEV
jgi:hypothetical protein